MSPAVADQSDACSKASAAGRAQVVCYHGVVPGLAQHTFSSGFSNSILLVRGGTFAGIASPDWPIKRFYLPCIWADVEALQRDF